IRVIVGQREGGSSWDKAVADGFVPGETLFPLKEAAERGTVVQYLLSDAGQKERWPEIKACLLYFSHGFSITYKDRTGVVPPDNVDVILVAPKGSGRTVRTNFLAGSGINSSIAVFQDYTGKARKRAIALGIAIGSGYLFPTTFEKTVEELTQSLIRLVAENGMDWMYANCSTTAQRGALDWKGRFRDAVVPVFDELYKGVASGEEAQITLDSNSAPDYREKLDRELEEIKNMEMWQAGSVLRSLRPERRKK
ncbi:MAG: ketol-acid reductoisomerase, partial [Deltaproteobacteria bacterium]|nr:ketol-acid reductoisomerase [Deltaproteobacteria bacterium]